MLNQAKIETPKITLIMNVPNCLTAVRVILTIVSAIFLLSGNEGIRWTAGVLLIFAWATDWLDGLAARSLEQSTPGGAIFDLVADRFLMSGISAITVILGFWRETSGLMPLAPYPALVLVWAADAALLAGIAFYLIKSRRIHLEIPAPPMAARLAFPAQMLTLVVVVLNIGPRWFLGGLMYLTIVSTLIASFVYLKKGRYIFTAG